MAIVSGSDFGSLAAKPPHGSCIPSLVASVLMCLLVFVGGKRVFDFVRKTVRPLALGAASALIGGIFFLPLVTGNSITISESWAVAFAGVLVVAIVALGVVCTLIALKGRFHFGHLYRVVFLVGLTSILFVPLAMAGFFPVAGYVCSVAMYQLIFFFMWMMVATVFKSDSKVAVRFFGLVYGCWSLGSLGGALASVAFTGSGSTDRVQLVVFVAALAVAVGYAAIFTERDADDLVQIMPLHRRRPFKEKCLAVAKQYKLTPRETEIAMLIAQGRDSAHIEEKLFLSRSTVQTHRMHVYQKLDIHNRQELLDVIEQADEGNYE